MLLRDLPPSPPWGPWQPQLTDGVMETQRGEVTRRGGRLPTEQGRRGLAVSMWGGRAPNTVVVIQAARGRGNPGLVWRGGYPDRCGREGSQELSPPQPAEGDGGRQKGPGPGGHPARRGCHQGGCRDAGGEERVNPQGVGAPPTPGAERLCSGRACPDTGYPVFSSPPKGGPSQVCRAEQSGLKDRCGAPMLKRPCPRVQLL